MTLDEPSVTQGVAAIRLDVSASPGTPHESLIPAYGPYFDINRDALTDVRNP